MTFFFFLFDLAKGRLALALVDPTWRKHSTFWSSRGSCEAILKNLAAGGVVSLICSKPSETKTTRANISAANN